MNKFNVEISASNTIKKEFDNFKQVVDFLKNCQGRLSIVDIEKNREIFFGTVEQFNMAYKGCLL